MEADFSPVHKLLCGLSPPPQGLSIDRPLSNPLWASPPISDALAHGMPSRHMGVAGMGLVVDKLKRAPCDCENRSGHKSAARMESTWQQRATRRPDVGVRDPPPPKQDHVGHQAHKCTTTSCGISGVLVPPPPPRALAVHKPSQTIHTFCPGMHPQLLSSFAVPVTKSPGTQSSACQHPPPRGQQYFDPPMHPAPNSEKCF